MQLGSSGARAATRNVSNRNMLLHPPGAARSFHTPLSLRPKPSAPLQGVARRLLTDTRGLLGRFFAQLTAPGIGTVPSARSFHGGSTSIPSIHSRMSFAARTHLSKPGAGQYLPRVPTAPRPCIPTNMGLGAARRFSSGRTVFQSFADNVPVATRSFYQVDWDIKASKDRENFKKSLKAGSKKCNTKERLRPKRQILQSISEQTSPEVEIDKYFPSHISEVTTELLIPLAPTPLSHGNTPAPMSVNESLLPIHELAFIHNSHELHSLRVSSLFSRLDAANVWEQGVLCSAYAHHASTEGVCTILKVEFVGWTKDEVRSVIGESGTGWCVLEETRIAALPDMDALSDTSSVLSDLSGSITSDTESSVNVTSDSGSQSFVLPTLDFSSSFSDASTTPFEVIHPSRDSQSETWSNADATESWVEDRNEWFGFSSDFANRRNK